VEVARELDPGLDFEFDKDRAEMGADRVDGDAEHRGGGFFGVTGGDQLGDAAFHVGEGLPPAPRGVRSPGSTWPFWRRPGA